MMYVIKKHLTIKIVRCKYKELMIFLDKSFYSSVEELGFFFDFGNLPFFFKA